MLHASNLEMQFVKNLNATSGSLKKGCDRCVIKDCKKEKNLRKHSLNGKIAAPVLLKLFINGSEICLTTEAP